jgi:eukaryotic-like serine/threonine-protein kinase
LSQLKICPVCSTEYPANERFCPRDGSALRSQGAANDLVGTIIAERYHIIKKLGEGGMGQVYLAEHVKMGRKSAVKVMNPGMVQNVDAVSRFNREAQNASRINHPNVAGIYDFGETPDGLVYLAMEFVEGKPLTEIIREHGALPPMRASEIARQTAEGLSVAHDMGIVHRDLKPDNIMVAKGRQGADLVKVVDFGIAKAAASDDQKVTKTGMVVGTPEYMSPEQLSGDPLDSRSDIYALALVTFNMLTGKLPFPGESMQETMIMRLTDDPHPLSSMKPDVSWPADLQAVMDKALAREAPKRYAHASEYAKDLVEAIDRMPATRITSMGTQVVGRVSQGSAATVQVEVPKTRIASADEVNTPPARPAASPAATPTKSKVGMYAGIGGVLLAAGVAGAIILKPGGGKPAPISADSVTPTGTPVADSTRLASPPPSTAPNTSKTESFSANLPDVDSALVQLNKRATDDTTQAGNTIILSRLQALSKQLKTADQRVSAAITEAMARLAMDVSDPKACDALRRVATEAPNTKHASDFTTMFSSCPK